ncbi:MAG TPA: hypothetical protein VGC20_03085 [bacterium]|jgi:hypothetical protein
MKRKGKQEITQQEVSAALARFLKQGGMIKQLPDQNFRPSGPVGGDKYQAYESLNDLPTLAGATEQVA